MVKEVKYWTDLPKGFKGVVHKKVLGWLGIGTGFAIRYYYGNKSNTYLILGEICHASDVTESYAYLLKEYDYCESAQEFWQEVYKHVKDLGHEDLTEYVLSNMLTQ